ncbi:MAG: hydroxymethylpyrimidine/phosphomethylpyrimidine kinase [Zoogloeaceae bacterium]|jgi:hydroxymethylpyrimidine/phosphomethylpyrimidine kinase|nr:hydroxymethylpyrimidine/phosphomethylpyrimidine kinase [Zoogloeaceae bacterium]
MSAITSGSVPPPTPLPAVLVFASSDPACGAGLQADLLTLAALSCQPLTVVCGLTVQDSLGVSQILPVPAEFIVAQAQALLADMPVAAFKVGALMRAENVNAVADIVAAHPDIPLVVDPVLSSGRGDAFADDALILALNEKLMPLTTVATPNSREAMRLATDAPDHLLITGGHEPGEKIVNHLYAHGERLATFSWPRLPGDFHGTGCAFASALAAGLAHGQSIPEAAQAAGDFVWQAALHARQPGRGQRFLQHLRGLPL